MNLNIRMRGCNCVGGFDIFLKTSDAEYTVTPELEQLVARAAEELKAAGAREVYLFGSAARRGTAPASDLDLAVTGLPPSLFYHVGARLSDVLGRSVDLVDLDVSTPFTRHLRQEHELLRVG